MTTNLGFWKQLKIIRQTQGKPITVLAPMANVTDFAFRQIVAECGPSIGLKASRPDVFYSEFISCDGMVATGAEKFRGELYFEKSESPIVVQFFGSKPENFYKCARLAVKMGYDGIDINMGCPDKSVEKQGGGAALIRKPELAKEIILATKEGAEKLPISVKTRLGYTASEIDVWIPKLMEAKPAAITIHGRTRKEMSKVPANWNEIARAGEIIRTISPETLIIGNGDVKNISDAHQKVRDFNLDGIMVGRGIFDNLWLFNYEVEPRNISPKQKIDLLLKHVDKFEKLWGTSKNFDTLKRFFKIYINGWNGAKDLRMKLMAAKSGQEVNRYIKENII